MALVVSRPGGFWSPRVAASLAALGLAGAVGVTLPVLGPSALIVAVGLLALVVTSRWPVLWLLGLVALTSSVFQYGELPRIGAAGTSLYAPEVLLLLLVGWGVYRTVRGAPVAEGHVLPGVLVAGLLIATVVSVVGGAVVHGRPLQENMAAARFMALYALYFPTRQLLATRQSYRWVLIGLLGLGGLTAVVYDLVVLTPVREALVGYPWFAATIQGLYVSPRLDTIDAGRVYMPGRALIQVLLFPSLVLALTLKPGSPAHRAAIGLTLLLGASVVLIFTRAVWLTTIVALLFLVGLARGPLRLALLKLAGVGLAVAVVLVIATTVFGEGSRLSPVDIVWNRFSTIVVDNINDENFAFRIRESQLILERVNDSWLTGAGFGTPVTEQWSYDLSSGQYAYANVFANHNGYLSLLLNEGLLGLLPFLGLCVVALVFACGRRWGTLDEPLILAGGLGFGVSLVRVLMNGLTESTFSDSFTVPLLVISLAFLERAVFDRRAAKRASLPSP